MIGFIVWSAVALFLLLLAALTWRAKKPAGFFAGIRPPKIRDVRRYNRALALLWVGYALLFELLGLPFLFLHRNKALMAVPLLGIPMLTLALVAAYHVILSRYEKK